MREKRFTHKKWYNDRQLFDGEEPFAIVDVYIQAEEICNKLNELYEEKELWKGECERLKGLYYLENGKDKHLAWKRGDVE